MTIYVRILAVCLLCVSLISCGGDRSTESQNIDSPGNLATKISNHVFEIAYGQSAVLTPENLSVTFESVLQDSRCASDVVCIWAGEAALGFRLVSAAGDTHFVTLALLGGCESGCESYASLKDTLGYRFQLVQVAPYPISTVQTPAEDYVATLAVFPVSPIEAVDGQVMITDQDPSLMQGAPFAINDIDIEGDILTLGVEYSGGCNEHAFELHMSPAAFAESLPVQANLYLRHIDSGDPCGAQIRESASFDLRPLAQLFEIDYGGLDCIALNVFKYTDGSEPAVKGTVIYHPADAPPTTWCSPQDL